MPNCAIEGSTTNAAGTACLLNCTAGGETADSNDDLQCDSNCADLGQILTSTGDSCMPDYAAFSWIINAAGTSCLPNCATEGSIKNLEGNQCVYHCNAEENQLIGVDGLQCVAACSLGEFVGLTGDRCLVMCPDGSDPHSTNPPQCQCQLDLILNSVGDQCVSSGKDKKSADSCNQ